MSLLPNDLRPRYPRPRPLTMREEWAALRARLDAAAACLADGAALRRRFALCQTRYDALLAGEEPPPPPPPDPRRCGVCGAPAEGVPRALLPGLPPAQENVLPLCPLCRLALGPAADPLAHLAATGRAPSLALARAHLSLVRRYARDRGFDGRFYLLDLLRLPHPFDLGALERDYAFLARFLRSAGRQPALREEAPTP